MASGRGRYCSREVLPFAAMVIVECANVGNSTLFKAASDKGMSYTVFLVYSTAISILALTPFAFIFSRKAQLPPFGFALVGRICLLGLLGYIAQMCGYKGIQYSSPTLSSAISNLTPAFTFVLAIIFRMEKLDLKSLTSQAKILGTVVSISGALVVVLYEGPPVIRTSSRTLALNQPLGLISSQSDWALGGLLLTLDYLILSVWYIIQTQTVRMYPAEFLVVLLYSTCVTLISAPVGFFLEPDLKAWSISTEIMLLAVLYAAIVGAGLATVVHAWGLKVKGPVYVALFRPLSIAIAAILGVVFLGDTLYLGSVIGAILIAIGFYVVLWGKGQEENSEEYGVSSIESPASENVPLLR